MTVPRLELVLGVAGIALIGVLAADPDVTATNRFGGTALIPAADRGHVAMVRALLDHTRRSGYHEIAALLEAG